MEMPRAEDVVQFWFSPENRENWFVKSEQFDGLIRDRFAALQAEAASGVLDGWLAQEERALALVILLDQFPRNMFRGTARAFASDGKARMVADEALARRYDRKIAAFDAQAPAFFYLPFMHSEDLADQERAVALYEAAGDDDGLGFAKEHRDIIARFGRFPHRNAALKRESTKEEHAFLETHSGF